MKRGSQGGSSPAPKLFCESEHSSEELLDNIDFQLLQSQSTSHDEFDFSPLRSSSLSQPTSDILQALREHSDGSSSETEQNYNYEGWPDSNSSESSLDLSAIRTEKTFNEVLDDYVTTLGPDRAASKILENNALKEEILKLIFIKSHHSLKSSLKDSVLNAKKDKRDYLLSLTPQRLCREFQSNSEDAFLLLVCGLLGVANPETVFDSQHLLNNIAMLYSTVAKVINRQSTGYALLLTTVARDGGLREDSLKLFSGLCHPRTSQKHDSSVLAHGWDEKLRASLKKERDHFEEESKARARMEDLLANEAEVDTVESAKEELEDLLDAAPPQTEMVWDNLNLRTSHRFQRAGDNYNDSNLDWMASLWITNRVNANHMENTEGVALKDIENLTILDFIPSEKEKTYVFQNLVCYFAYRLVQRHPILFKTIASCIRRSKPHQFQEEMNKKSSEFTGSLFTKSESRTEDLINMMAEVQLNVQTFEDTAGEKHCYEKKIVSGDNKTEKNMFYGILRLNAIRFF